MGLFRRRGAAPSRAETRAVQEATLAHLTDFVRSRVGVEAYLEPATHVTQTTMVLIATTGEWTRRRVPDHQTGRDLARNLGIPVYDVQLTGYPQRMRDWNARQRPRR